MNQTTTESMTERAWISVSERMPEPGIWEVKGLRFPDDTMVFTVLRFRDC
jgi:hypothetical protein